VSTASHRGTAPAVWVALAALALALAAGLWLAFDPYSYSGASGSATSSGVTTEQTGHASLIEENGSWVIGLFAVPVALTGVGVLGAARKHRILAWSAAWVLLAFSLVTGFSIGLFYAPAAVALLVAAALSDSRGAPSGD
jgi:hypothetical protein